LNWFGSVLGVLQNGSFVGLIQELIYGTTIGQPSSSACYVKATFVLVPSNTSAESSSSDSEMAFSRHITVHGTRYSTLYLINDLVCDCFEFLLVP